MMQSNVKHQAIQCCSASLFIFMYSSSDIWISMFLMSLDSYAFKNSDNIKLHIVILFKLRSFESQAIVRSTEERGLKSTVL